MVGCAAAEGSAAVWLSSPSLLSSSSGSGMYSMQSTGAASGKDLTVRGEGRFREKISTWPPEPSCPPPTWAETQKGRQVGPWEQRQSAAPAPPATCPKRLLAPEVRHREEPPSPSHSCPAVTEGHSSQLPWQQVRFRAQRKSGKELRWTR